MSSRKPTSFARSPRERSPERRVNGVFHSPDAECGGYHDDDDARTHHDSSQLAGEALPAHLAERAIVSAALNHDAPDLVIARAAEGAAGSLRAAHSRALLDRVLELAGALGRGAAGVPDTQRALRAESVDLLLLSPEFLRVQPEQAEAAVRAALLRGAEVEVLSGDAAEYLDETAEGIAARLRFATDGAALHGQGGRSGLGGS